ncbi:monovalent cation/H(+) antiporter subunit G [Nesterenkonia flava]|uniref:Monovalent cation/H(+) antiporter subunit G n=1 Tax=Nesterenkonia flava TaxID=469799 RepID=A0ABU1FVY4_9MICC|nr:monovalent cation/H(+) antiporter subunit G [Nesterenkonia flava]MDR5712831.1 monovalent cation/H(+) antiporter subunit G [Nesterenkonia flava]
MFAPVHALTKADNLGLGMVLAGAALWLEQWSVAGLLLVTWLLALAAASVSAHVIAGLEADHEDAPDDDGTAPDPPRHSSQPHSSPTSGEARG